MFATFALLAALPCVAALPPPVASELTRAKIPASNVAIYVQEVGAASPIVAVNASRPMNPASAMKLLTTFAAMDLLGPAFTWKTEVWTTGALRDGTLDGDLVFRGGGDPRLTLEGFWLLLRTLRARGVRDVRGDLIIDRSYFERVDSEAPSLDGDLLRPYNVRPDAFLVNWFNIHFTFIPVAERVQVTAEPHPAQLEIRNDLRLDGGPCGDWRARMKATFQTINGKMQARFAGSIPRSCGENVLNRALFSNTAYVDHVFRMLWLELGGSLQGKTREGALAPDATLLASTESPPLYEIVRDVNKFSNNVMARQVFLSLSAEPGKAPGSAARSSDAIASWLRRRSLTFPELVMENGAGLSRDERISAEHLGQLLLAAWKSPMMPELIASLPVAGQDGTMRKRMRDDAIAGRAHVKTGSLADVRSVAGYVLARNGKRFVVIFLVNHARAGDAQSAQDALIRWVHEIRSIR